MSRLFRLTRLPAVAVAVAATVLVATVLLAAVAQATTVTSVTGSRIAKAAHGPTKWKALNAAIARIPTYHRGDARWVVSNKYDYWGTADWYHDVLYVDPDVPVARLYDVAAHEWSHELSVLDYGGRVNRAKRAMNRYFGGHGLVGAERAADCMALEQGAVWTHYTTCRNVHWRAGARRLVNGKHLKFN